MGCPEAKRSVCHPSFHHLHPVLLQLQVRHEHGKSRLGNDGEVGSSIPKLLVQAGGESAEEEFVGDYLAKVTELVGKLL